MSGDVTAAVNPLTGDLISVTVVDPDGSRNETPGKVVAPGLAITADLNRQEHPDRPRFALTHLNSGLAVRFNMCGTHILQAAEEVVSGYTIDWTASSRELVAAASKIPGIGTVKHRCRAHCTGDAGEAPLPYRSQCLTCGWEPDAAEEELPTTLQQAIYCAQEHRCEPEVQVLSPVTGRWHPEWALRHAEATAVPLAGWLHRLSVAGLAPFARPGESALPLHYAPARAGQGKLPGSSSVGTPDTQQ